MEERTLKFANIVRKIGRIDSLTSTDLVEISRNLFDLTILCGCDEHNFYDYIEHKCTLFDPHDSQHTPMCSCCQKKMLLYYLGRCMEKLANEDRLPEFLKIIYLVRGLGTVQMDMSRKIQNLFFKSCVTLMPGETSRIWK